MINLKEIIKNCNKYHYIYINKQNKVYKYKSFSEKQTISIKNNEKLVLIKLKTILKKLYYKEKKSPIKASGGPLYAEVSVYNINGKVESKFKNKVYFPKKYLQDILNNDYCKYIKKDILKIGDAYINDKLNQGLISINKITDL
jgi:hypothetical protein